MNLTAILPAVALAATVALSVGLLSARRPRQGAWILPLVAAVAFAAFSVVTIMQEGPTGFWPNHSEDLWGNQVWIDLLVGIVISWSFLVAEGRRRGMRTLPWLLLIFASGNIGVLAMLARLLFLRERAAATNASSPGFGQVSAQAAG